MMTQKFQKIDYILFLLAVLIPIVAIYFLTFEYIDSPFWHFLLGTDLTLCSIIIIRIIRVLALKQKIDYIRLRIVGWVQILIFGTPLLLVIISKSFIPDMASSIRDNVGNWFDGIALIFQIPLAAAGILVMIFGFAFSILVMLSLVWGYLLAISGPHNLQELDVGNVEWD